MRLFFKIALLMSLINISLIAEEKRERETSVRDTIDSFGALQEKEVSTVDKLQAMFVEGEFVGQIRMMSALNKLERNNESNNYATALGGVLKYELASFYGLNAGIAMTTSQDINFGTGEAQKYNNELSSSAGHRDVLSEAYVNYKYEAFNVRLGRQVIDTPLADSDDIRMIQNTFEAYMASYDLADFSFLAGNIRSWQGSDVGLDDGWVSTGKDGVWLAGVSYEKELQLGAWYYNTSKESSAMQAIYLDIGYEFVVSDNTSIHTAGQYLQEKEKNNSGVEAQIYGGVVECVTYGIGLNLAYNKSEKKVGKRSFSGVGGGEFVYKYGYYDFR